MWPRNILIYRREAEPLSGLEAELAKSKPVKPTSLERSSQGWTPPLPFDDKVAPTVAGARIVKLKRYDKILPAQVIKSALKAKVAEVEKREGRKLGKKEKRELKDTVTDELLGKAMLKESETLAVITPSHVFVDSGSPTKGEALLSALIAAVPLRTSLLSTNKSPSQVMTDWLVAGSASGHFELGADCTLESPEKGGAKVTVRRADLTTTEVRKHIEAGRQVTSLALLWRDKIRFTLTSKLQLKSIKFLDVLQESVKSSAEGDAYAEAEATCQVMTAELDDLVAELVDVLGGVSGAGHA
jgi:recombination associated protein RdgC